MAQRKCRRVRTRTRARRPGPKPTGRGERFAAPDVAALMRRAADRGREKREGRS